MLDIFKDNSNDYFDSYPELFWNDQVRTWSLNSEQEWFKWNMESWQHATQVTDYVDKGVWVIVGETNA